MKTCITGIYSLSTTTVTMSSTTTVETDDILEYTTVHA